MLLYFGLALEDDPWRMEAPPWGGIFYVGPQGLLNVLEAHTGLAGAQPLDEYLRIEQYRQLLKEHLEQAPEAFFAESFHADPLATATALLEYRDELLLAGWDFSDAENMPARLDTIARIERRLHEGRLNGKPFAPGFADRFAAVSGVLPARPHPVKEIRVVEPPELLPAYFRRLFAALSESGTAIVWLPQMHPSEADTDLAHFQRAAELRSAKPDSDVERNSARQLRGDGSLLLLRARRDCDLAAWTAALARRNQQFRPVCLIADRSRALDAALMQEGLPGLGLLSASQARPTLQVLKLAPVFLWNPVDPFKIMEFVSLAVKPLEDGLAAAIAESLAQTPGLHGEGWRIAVARYFDELDHRAAREPGLDPAKVRRQYRFWFERKRYDASRAVPKAEAVEIYRHIEQWAKEALNDNASPGSALAALKEQAGRIVELLEVLPEAQLGYLELERIVRTIYQPAPLQLSPREQGHLPFVTRPGALINPAEELLWWNFIQKEPDHFFSRWYKPELDWLASKGLYLEGPAQQNDRLLWQRRRPVLAAQKRLVLLLPQTTDGEDAPPHPLFGDLSAAFSNLDRITFNVDSGVGRAHWGAFFDLPETVTLERRQLGRPRPFLHLHLHRQLEAREKETFTSLETLLYYPYQWVFRHKIKLVKSSILSLVKDEALMGNLAHRFFERLFEQDTAQWTRQDLDRWVEQESETLLAREGAVLLLYGREPERIGFLNRVKQSAWSLMHLIRQNGWEVESTEQPIEGAFEGTALHGRADLVLKRGDERAVLDLKWRGIGYREDSIRNEADLQLVLYSKLTSGDGAWAHTAFFIMEKARLLARNNEAFKEIAPIRPGSDHTEINERILLRMQQTYRWRIEQLRQGNIEVRCKQTQAELEELYAGQLLDLLEMKGEDARYDDYRVLINLVE
ncbi:MAG: PD-(D/E)XK nuclease family protein [Saprospiraceae bacterium]|nr:PD-(D/E)XK nuclease family protein [Saprospiraceae bacterium]